MFQMGGAITCFQSSMRFTGLTYLLNNKTTNGGAILATECTIVTGGEATIIEDNVAMIGSGVVFVSKGSCSISKNQATMGGGIYASSSVINVYQSSVLLITNNNASFGGGVYLEVDPKLNILKTMGHGITLLLFAGNHANYGGAIYVADNTSSAACSSNYECFVQTLSLDPGSWNFIVNIRFTGNTANHGVNLFGGLMYPKSIC